MHIRVARQEDLAAISQLLNKAALPTGDLTDAMPGTFFAVDDEERSLMACAGLETYGDAGLLRSLAVAEPFREQGIARTLVGRIENFAASQGISNLWLLTTTARRFFENLGYRSVDRRHAPATVQQSSQFVRICPSSAVCMLKQFQTPEETR